ncbi:TPA: hypothetical protein ACGQHT_002645 [Escherichia coli]
MKINKVGLLVIVFFGDARKYNADIIPAARRNFVATSSHKDKVIKDNIHNMRIKDLTPELISFQQNDI